MLFSLNQSIWRKVQELGLDIKYKENKQFRQAVKLISTLALLPVNMIKKGNKIKIIIYKVYFLF